MAYLNSVTDGDMALLYIDAHGDLNTPESSNSKLFYGMSLRALLGDSAAEIVRNLPSTLTPEQLVMCANRALMQKRNDIFMKRDCLSFGERS